MLTKTFYLTLNFLNNSCQYQILAFLFIGNYLTLVILDFLPQSGF